jgi:hypothetical protein
MRSHMTCVLERTYGVFVTFQIFILEYYISKRCSIVILKESSFSFSMIGIKKFSKIRVVAPTAHITTLKGNARTFVNLRENFDAFLGPESQAERSMLRVRIFLPEFFFSKKRKRITVTFFIYFFVCFLIKFCKY